MTNSSSTDSRKWLILIICCMSLFIVGIDTSGLNLALPSIEQSLHATSNQLQWIIDSYNIVLAGLLMLSGSMGDRFGRKKSFILGLTIFGSASALCAFATSPEFLITARGIQAIGGSMLNPIAMSIIVNTFSDKSERARTIGVWGGAIGLSTALGPLVGGVLVEKIGWQTIFWMNVPIALLAIILTFIFVPESKAEHPRKLDVLGQLLIMLTLVALTFGIIEGRIDGWMSTTVVNSFVVSAVSLVLLMVTELKVREPVLDLNFFRSIPFSGAVLSAVLGFMSMSGFLFLNTLYLQMVRGYTPIEAGLLSLPMAICTFIFAPVSGRLVGSVGPRRPMILAGLFLATGSLVLTLIENSTPVGVLILAYVFLGIGQGLLNAPITNTAVSGMPRSQSGVASAVASCARQVGNALGVALYGTLALGTMPGSYATFAHSTHSSWWCMVITGLVLAIIGLIVTTQKAQSTAQNFS